MYKDLKVHRGTDFGTASTGIHLHSDPSVSRSISKVKKVISPMKTKAAITPSKKDLAKINAWADNVAANDNDMIYLRKKNGIMYVMKVEPHRSGTWEKLDPSAVAVISDVHGAKLEDVTLASLRDELVPPTEKEYKPIPNIPLGWYQDDKANLYKYEGAAVWEGADMKEWGKLLNMAEAGILEFIG